MLDEKKTEGARAAAAVVGAAGFNNLESWRLFGLGLNQRQMAEKIGVSQGMISALESGRSKRPTDIQKYWRAYQLSPADFYRLFRAGAAAEGEGAGEKNV